MISVLPAVIAMPFALPAPFGYAEIEFTSLAYDDSLFEQHGLTLPERIAASCLKRRREFFWGRICANLALAQLTSDYSLGAKSVGVGVLPFFGTNRSGSISHTGRVAAAICVNGKASSVGLDVEHIMSARQAGEIGSYIAHAEEVTLARRQGLDHPSAISLIFSLKEATYKACSALFRATPDFSDARVMSMNSDTCEISIHAFSDSEAHRVHCHYRVDTDTVHTCALRRPILS